MSKFVLLILKLLQNKKGRISTLATVIASLVKYASVLIGFCWVLSIIEVNVSTIFASVGIVALILGFGAESLVADMVTGVFILFENQSLFSGKRLLNKELKIHFDKENIEIPFPQVDVHTK